MVEHYTPYSKSSPPQKNIVGIFYRPYRKKKMTFFSVMTFKDHFEGFGYFRLLVPQDERKLIFDEGPK